MTRAVRRGAALALTFVLAITLAFGAGCGASGPGVAEDPLTVAREAGRESSDGETIGRWLLTELVAPGGGVAQARSARERLDKLAKEERGPFASLARAIDDEAHGALRSAARNYLATVEAARAYDGSESELLAWYSTSRLLRLRPSLADLWTEAKPMVERALDAPGRIGFRARGDLVDWWGYEAARKATGGARAVEDDMAKRLGCVDKARFAGPFGRPAPLDVVTRFEPERPGAWPTTFTQDPRRVEPPRVITADRKGCAIRAKEASPQGVHYVETFLDSPQDRDVVLVVQGAWSILIDDVEVLARDPRIFGIWPRFGVAVRLSAGRHRLVARLGAAETMIRVLDPAGRPLDITSSADPSQPYTLTPPGMLPDPNPHAPFLAALGVPETPRWPQRSAAWAPIDPADPIMRFVAAELALVEGQGDLASVLLEPLAKDPARATPIVMAVQATYIENDAIFPDTDARDLALDFRTRAVEKDARLWFARTWLVVDAADKQGPREAIPALEALAQQFSEVPAIPKALASMYARLGYKAENQRTLVDAARRFPNDTELIRQLLGVYDEGGRHAEADRAAARLKELEPTSTIDIERALSRGDLLGAADILRKETKDQKDEQLARRIADLLVRAGQKKETLDVLERALADDPSSASARLSLADARYAGGDHSALRNALVDAIQRGAETTELRDAIALVSGKDDLEAFRIDPIKTIAEFEATGAAQAGLARHAADKPGAGNAARVLDYAALWVQKDGSARMLEHEILHMQSREAISEHAEQKLPRGRLLRIRTIKRSGQVFEPEIVSGKPTATMPHLEVGDYIETETIYDLPGDRAGGRSFVSPRWFFREEKLDYFRSEFIVVTPKGKTLDIETTGSVPEPVMTEDGAFVTRRWRVDKSPALPEEPFGARVDEFLPSVRAGWGIKQEDVLERFLDASTSMVPPDPRLVRIARTIATNGASPATQAEALRKVPAEERARRIYRWVLQNVEAGRESDPRRAVLGKTGNRAEAFIYLVRLVGIDARHGLVQDRLAPPPRGPISASELFSQIAVAMPIGPKGEVRWMIVADKFAPFGFMPSSLRGQPAVVLRPGLPRVTTPTTGAPDGVTHEGEAHLAADGSAIIHLSQRYEGRLAIELRGAIEKLPDDRLKDIIESELLPQAIPGGRLASLDIENLGDLDAPLVLKMKVEASSFAKPTAGALVLSPPFRVSLAPFASLPSRETPLLLTGGAALRIAVKLRIKLPKGAHVESLRAPSKGENADRRFEVSDKSDADSLVLDRWVDVPAGRIKPDQYASFVGFTRAIDEAFQQDVVIKLR